MKLKTDFLLPAMMLFSSNGYAFDWLLEPSFSGSERYDDNVTMQVNEKSMVSSMITTLSPNMLLGYIADDNELKANFKLNQLLYHSASELDFAEKMLDISHEYETDLFKTNLQASYYEQSSINTQLVDPTNNITGQTLIPRTTRSLSPDVLINLTERNSLQLNYSYQDVTFDRPQSLKNLSYSDYTSQQYSATLIHTLTERLSANLMGAYSLFDSVSNYSSDQSLHYYDLAIKQATNTTYKQNSATFFYQAGVQYAFDEQTQLSASAGMRYMDTRTHYAQTATYDYHPPGLNLNPGFASDQSNQSSGHVFSITLNRKQEWGNFSFNAGQQINPASSGTQQQTTSVGGQALYNLSDRWSTGINASYQKSSSTSTFSTNGLSYNRVYMSVSPNLQWRWTPEINLQLSYTHRQQEYTDSHQTAMGDSVQLQFSYQPQINRQVK